MEGEKRYHNIIADWNCAVASDNVQDDDVPGRGQDQHNIN